MKVETLRRVLLSGSVSLCTIGAAVLGIAVAKAQFSKFVVIPETAEHIMLAAGGGFVAVGLLALIAGVLTAPAGLVLDETYSKYIDRHVCLFAAESEIESLHSLYTDYFGQDVFTVEEMKAILRRCRRAFALVYVIEDSSLKAERRSLVGSFKVLPVTEEAVRLLEARQVTGSTLRPEHIARYRRDTSGFYVGDVVATGLVARGMVLGLINVACEAAVQRGLPIYARPLTKEGRRAMKRRGFLQVADGKSAPELGEICRLIVRSHTSFSLARRRRNTHGQEAPNP